MAETIEFSVLGYYPSIATEENINVGILFHNIDRDERSFYITKNWKRVEGFDDELDVEFLKQYLIGLKSEVANSLFNLEEKFSIADFTRFYVNELRFGEVRSAYVEDADSFIEDTKKICMRFDFDRGERVSKASEISYLKKLMRKDSISFSMNPILGTFDENVKFDFMIDEYGFKFFSFEGKNLKQMMNSVKSWAFTAGSLSGKYETVFIVDVDEMDSKEYEILKSILEKNGRVLTSTEAVDFICSLSSAIK